MCSHNIPFKSCNYSDFIDLGIETISPDEAYWFGRCKEECVACSLFVFSCFCPCLSRCLLDFLICILHFHIFFLLYIPLSKFQHCLSFAVRYYRWQGSESGLDRAQSAGRPAALPHERCCPAGVYWSAGHAGWRSLLKPSRGHCSGHGHSLPCYVHQHRLVVKEENQNFKIEEVGSLLYFVCLF